MNSSHKKRIGVIRGGRSSEYEASLETGKEVLQSLDDTLFVPVDIFIDREGNWHVDGVSVSSYTALQFVDIVFNALHGEYGEDGTVQAFLEEIGKPFIGSKSLESKIAFDKHSTKILLKENGVSMPRHVIFRLNTKNLEEKLVDTWKKLQHPLMVKPNKAGSSLGIRLARNFSKFRHYVSVLLSEGIEVMVEEFVEGREVTVFVIESMRGQRHYSAIPIEVVHGGQYFDETTKRQKNYVLRPMHNFSKTERDLVQKIAVHTHKSLGLRHYSRSDFIISKKGVYFLEINTLPALSEKSLAKTSLEESGISLRDFLTHVLVSI